MTSNQQNAAAAAAASGGHSATSTGYNTANHLYNNHSNPSSTSSDYTHSRSSHSQPSLGLPNPYRYGDGNSIAPTANTLSSSGIDHPIKPSPKHPLSALATPSTSTASVTPQLTPQDLSYSAAFQKHWFWNPSLLYYTQHVQAASQFLPYATHAQTGSPSSSYFPSTLLAGGGGYTKSESSIDLTAPSAGDALSDCDSGKSSPATINLTTSASNHQQTKSSSQPTRKRNPYSIEELLKKPEKRMRLNASFDQKTFPSLSPKKDDCNVSVCSASSSSSHSSTSSHISCVGEDSCDDERRSPLNVAATETDDNCETVEVVH